MAFIDNSGDIILDAVLTDLGRQLLARGNKSFDITQFALADDEINYALFDITAATGAESTTIRQLPVFEASTANDTALKYKMLNIVRTDHLYMAIMKLNELMMDTRKTSAGYFAVCVDKITEGNIRTAGNASIAGVMNGANPKDNDNHIRIDQGWDTTEVPYTQTLPADQFESDWTIKIDNRFGEIMSPDNSFLPISTTPQSNMATYEAWAPLDQASGPAPKHAPVWPIDNILGPSQSAMVIAGPVGNMLNIKIYAKQLLQTSYDPFIKFGALMDSQDITGVSGTADLYYIDTSLKIQGGDTSFSIDVPVRFIKSNI